MNSKQSMKPNGREALGRDVKELSLNSNLLAIYTGYVVG